MSQALGRVLQKDDLEGPRGPDGRHRITVPAAWLEAGFWIELDLPRMLECASCRGGGCDACDRSGAVTTRGRKELGEIVEVKLPETTEGVALRLPRRGGLPDDARPDLARGVLVLMIVPGDAASDGVRLVERAPEPALVTAPTPVRYLFSPTRLLVAAAVLFALLLAFALTR